MDETLTIDVDKMQYKKDIVIDKDNSCFQMMLENKERKKKVKKKWKKKYLQNVFVVFYLIWNRT